MRILGLKGVNGYLAFVPKVSFIGKVNRIRSIHYLADLGERR